MYIYILILRVIHILGGVFWAGWAFILAGFLEPAVDAAGPAGGEFQKALVQKTRIMPVMIAAPLLTILTGILLYWETSGGFSLAWIASGNGLALTIGGLAAIVAFVAGMVINRPTAERIGALGREMQASGGPPTPEQQAEMQVLQERLSRAGAVGAVLMLVAVIGMALP